MDVYPNFLVKNIPYLEVNCLGFCVLSWRLWCHSNIRLAAIPRLPGFICVIFGSRANGDGCPLPPWQYDRAFH